MDKIEQRLTKVASDMPVDEAGADRGVRSKKLNDDLTGDEAIEEVMKRLGKFLWSTYYEHLGECVDYYDNGKVVNGRVVMRADSTYKIH